MTDSCNNTSIQTPPYERLKGIGTRDCAVWREAILVKHWPIMGCLVNHYKAIAEEHDHVAANNWLREAHERLRLGNTPLWLHSDDGP